VATGGRALVIMIDCFVLCLLVTSSLWPSKCIVLHVAPADQCSDCFSYCIDNHTLPVVKSVTDLGVMYDTKLKFDLH